MEDENLAGYPYGITLPYQGPLTQNYNKLFLSVHKYRIIYVSQHLSNLLNYLINDKLGKRREEIFRTEFILYNVLYNN
jgi:hypothetical protein